MPVVNRCAIGLGPRQPLIEWSRTISEDDTLAWGAEDRSLYLIPVYESEEEALALLAEVYEEIFARELESWSLDEASWPSPRTFTLFREWFEIHFYDLIEDLCDGDLEHEEGDEAVDEEADQPMAERIQAVLRDAAPG